MLLCKRTVSSFTVARDDIPTLLAVTPSDPKKAQLFLLKVASLAFGTFKYLDRFVSMNEINQYIYLIIDFYSLVSYHWKMEGKIMLLTAKSWTQR